MNSMFFQATNFNKDISEWDVEKVVDKDYFDKEANSDWKQEHKPKFGQK